MQIGVHGLVFTGTFDEAGLQTAIAGTQAAGFDLLELPLMDPFAIDGALVRRMLDDHGVAMTSSLGLDAAHDLSSDDAAVSREGETLLEALPRMREAYCGTIAYQIEHLASHEQRMWLREMIETGAHQSPLDADQKRALLSRLDQPSSPWHFQNTKLPKNVPSLPGMCRQGLSRQQKTQTSAKPMKDWQKELSREMAKMGCCAK